MKASTVAFILLFILIIACSPGDGGGDSVALGDTIQTESGLRYFYQKRGDGRMVEQGSEVSAYLSLMVNGQVVWNTNESPDSLFTFIAGHSRVIQGFGEMAMLLREGDEVVVIIPDSLGYGATGSGAVIPPNATLIYDQFKVRNVSEPKSPISDTLFIAISTSGIEGMKSRYESIVSSGDSSKYHMKVDQIYSLWQNLSRSGQFAEALEVINYFQPKYESDMGMRWYQVLSYENMGLFQDAVEKLEVMIELDTTDDGFLMDKLTSLEIKRDSSLGNE